MSTFEIPDDHVARRIAVDVAMIRMLRGQPHVGLIRRKNEPHVGKLALPGGRQKPEDRDALDAACREVKEETGVEVDRKELDLLEFLDASGRDPRPGVPHVSVVFWAIINDERGEAPQAGDDADSFEWFPLRDATEDIMAFDHFLAIAKIRQRLSLCCHGCCT